MMVDAASRGANAIIAFATDGIFATHRLSVEIAQDKRLGNGKLRSAATACSFSQGCTLSRTSTLMRCRPTRLQSVHRRRVASAQPDYLQVRPLRNIWSRWLPRLGAKADPPFHFEYRACKTIGAADASRASCTLVGHWIAGTYSFGTLDRHIFRGREMQRDAQHRTEPLGARCAQPRPPRSSSRRSNIGATAPLRKPRSSRRATVPACACRTGCSSSPNQCRCTSRLTAASPPERGASLDLLSGDCSRDVRRVSPNLSR